MARTELLKRIYGPDRLDYQNRRVEQLLHKFDQSFSGGDVAIFRAPGRVNLIGEHTDYNGLPVLPMSINLDVMIACSRRKDNRVCLRSNATYPDAEFAISHTIPRSPPGSWDNYVKGAAQILQRCAMESDRSTSLRGFNAVVHGDIPAGSGLSSSAALVVCSALVLNEWNELGLNRQQLADLTARGERYVGTQGGGMDQTASLFGEINNALFIEFFPIRIQKIPIPSECAVVVCNSMVPAEKSASHRNSYNRRVIECRLGVAMINRFLGDNQVCRLGNLNIGDFDEFIEDVFDREIYSLSEIAQYCGVRDVTIRENYLDLSDGSLFNDGTAFFKIKSRCRHVLSEGARVRKGRTSLTEGDIDEFGRLMDASHVSCEKDYEISCPELNALVSICRDAGAIGARLSGAGFGGCVVSIVEKGQVASFLTRVEKGYYKNYLPLKRPELVDNLESASEHMYHLTTTPGAARIF